MWPVLTATLIPVITAVLGYVAGLHRDGRTERLLRERERSQEVQLAVMEVIEGCRKMLNGLVSGFNLKPFYDKWEKENLSKGEGAERKIYQDALHKGRLENLASDAEQIGSGSRQVNRAVTRLRILAPDLVIPAQELRASVEKMTAENLREEPLARFDSCSDKLARATQDNLRSPDKKLFWWWRRK